MDSDRSTQKRFDAHLIDDRSVEEGIPYAVPVPAGTGNAHQPSDRTRFNLISDSIDEHFSELSSEERDLVRLVVEDTLIGGVISDKA